MWKTVKINDVCLVTDYVANGSFKSLSDNVKYLTNDGHAILVRLTDFTKGWNGNYKYVDEHAYNFLAKTKLFAGDLLISNVGEPGKTFLVPELEMLMTLGPNSILVRPNNDVLNTKFFKYFIDSLYGKALLDKIISGTTQKKFNKTGFRNLEIPIPSLQEQERIVAKLDAAFAGIDKTVEDNIKKLFLTEDAFGKIVDFELNQLNKKFQSCSLGEMLDGVQYGTSTKCSKSGKYPVLRMGNMQFGKFILDDLVYLDDEDSFAKYKAYQGDVFFNRTNSAVHVGKAAILESDEVYLFAGYLIRLNYSRDKIDGNFLNYFLNAPSIREHGFRVMTSSVNQANINGTKLKAYPFLNIDIETQRFLSKKLKKIEYELHQSKNLLKKILNNFTKLKSSILAQELQSSEAA